MKIAGEDYFGSDIKTAPSPPMASKSLVFSPRIQLHDTWTSGEYDRRGEIATCNRLTPLLAQQIKEELNNFKMVRFTAHPTLIRYTTANWSRRWKFTRHPKFTPISFKAVFAL